MAQSQKERREAMILELDGEQTFDLLSWVFLFHVLDKFGFASTLAQIILGCYIPALAPRCMWTDPFWLEDGLSSRLQPVSLLFNLSIEVLAQLIRDEGQINGVINKIKEDIDSP